MLWFSHYMIFLFLLWDFQAKLKSKAFLLEQSQSISKTSVMTLTQTRTWPQTLISFINRTFPHSCLFFSLPLQMCVSVIQSWALPGGGNLWTASEPLNCATRTASAAHVTGSCASACPVGTKSAAPCSPPRSARARWRCCRTHRCTTADAREAWRRSYSACRTTGASTWVWLRVSLQHWAVSRVNKASCCLLSSPRVLSWQMERNNFVVFLCELHICGGQRRFCIDCCVGACLKFAWSAKRDKVDIKTCCFYVVCILI